MLNEVEQTYKILGPKCDTLYQAFNTVNVLCFLNLSFLVQHIITFVFAKRLGRFYEFPVLLHLTDAVLFVCSIFFSEWFRTKI